MIAAISGSVIPAWVCSPMLASAPQRSSKARCQATAPAPPVTSRVPSMSQRTVLIWPSPLTGPSSSRVSVVLQHVALAEGIEQRQRGDDDDQGGAEDAEDHVEGRVGRRALVDP